MLHPILGYWFESISPRENQSISKSLPKLFSVSSDDESNLPVYQRSFLVNR